MGQDSNNSIEMLKFDSTSMYLMDFIGIFYTRDSKGQAWVFQCIGVIKSLPPPCMVSIKRKLHRVGYTPPDSEHHSVIITGDQGKTFRADAGEVEIGDEILWNCTNSPDIKSRESYGLKYKFERG